MGGEASHLQPQSGHGLKTFSGRLRLDCEAPGSEDYVFGLILIVEMTVIVNDGQIVNAVEVQAQSGQSGSALRGARHHPL
jgi:hypothetical protein